MGVHKKIETSDLLWKHFQDYVTDTKARPFKVKDWVGAYATEVKREKERPLTMEGFENFCADKEIIKDLKDYFANDDGRYADFAPICQRIRNAIRQDQIEGGMAGMYNPSITQRLNGLADKQEVKVDTFDITLNLK